MDNRINVATSNLLDSLNLSLRTEIEELRHIILEADDQLNENVKWNSPNYYIGNSDRITLKLQSQKYIQIVLHRGAKTQPQPGERLLANDFGLLDWKSNDRAIMIFRNSEEIQLQKEKLTAIIRSWIAATI